jgi:RNA polymerase-binding transcription factor DksA/actin-like ATPase involved in cell morphogenesis
LKETAERGCFGGKKVKHVSLSHPVIFNKTEKERLKEAASLAGFKECRLVEEPLAAIHGYLASGSQAGNNILVFDMGGGTLDLAFLCKDGDDYHMPIPPMGEETGGDEFDRVLYDHFERKLEQVHGIWFGENGTCNLGVLAQCRKLKEKLTSAKSARFSHFDSAANIHSSFDMVREELEALFRDQVDRAIKMAATMLQKIEAGGFKLDTVLLVGGSTRIPVVRKRLAEILPIEPLETMHADVAVAMGASIGGSAQYQSKNPKRKRKTRLRSEGDLSADELAEYEERLHELRGQVVDEIHYLACDQKDAQVMRMLDESRSYYDHECVLNLMFSDQNILSEIDEALRRIHAGTYGICEETGKPIGRARLDAIPYARYSAAAQREIDKSRESISKPKNTEDCAPEKRPRDTKKISSVSVEIVVPPFPESVNDGKLTAWYRSEGELVTQGERLADIETEKIVLEVSAPQSGMLADIAVIEGADVKSGQNLGRIEYQNDKDTFPSLGGRPKLVHDVPVASQPPATNKDVGVFESIIGLILVGLVAGLIGSCGG